MIEVGRNRQTVIVAFIRLQLCPQFLVALHRLESSAFHLAVTVDPAAAPILRRSRTEAAGRDGDGIVQLPGIDRQREDNLKSVPVPGPVILQLHFGIFRQRIDIAFAVRAKHTDGMLSGAGDFHSLIRNSDDFLFAAQLHMAVQVGSQWKSNRLAQAADLFRNVSQNQLAAAGRDHCRFQQRTARIFHQGVFRIGRNPPRRLGFSALQLQFRKRNEFSPAACELYSAAIVPVEEDQFEFRAGSGNAAAQQNRRENDSNHILFHIQFQR